MSQNKQSESPQPVVEAENLAGVASTNLLVALDVASKAKLDLANAVKQAIECAVNGWHERWPGNVLPVVTAKTSPVMCYGGRPRRVEAHVTVEFYRE